MAVVVAGCGRPAPATLGTIRAKAASATILGVTTGTGSESLGMVNLDGHVAAQLTCAGHGTVTLRSPAEVSFSVACTPSGTSAVSVVESDHSVHVSRTPVRVDAPSGAHWRLMIYRVS